MKRHLVCSAAAALIAVSGFSLSAAAAPASTAPAVTTNTVTPAMERRARQAASRAGYAITGGVWAQGGYVFANATRRGASHQLTIDPANKVFASSENPPLPAAAAAAR